MAAGADRHRFKLLTEVEDALHEVRGAVGDSFVARHRRCRLLLDGSHGYPSLPEDDSRSTRPSRCPESLLMLATAISEQRRSRYDVPRERGHSTRQRQRGRIDALAAMTVIACRAG